MSVTAPPPAAAAPGDGALRGAGPRPHDVVRMSAVVDAFGLTPRAVRFYEQRGLIAPRRDRLNRRLYDAPMRARLSVITRLRRAGVGLGDIVELLAGAAVESWRSRAHDLLVRRRAAIEGELAAVDAAVGWLAGAALRRRTM